ncbi:MAG: formylmethanofuran dehydrogenase subunit A [Isosphaeraceae bacterium]
MSGLLKISGGRVIDPAHGIDQQPMDIWIRDGRVIPAPSLSDVKPDRTIDARGYVVMPGGVDIHCHVSGSKVDASRFLGPEERRLESGRSMPDLNLLAGGTLGSCPTSSLTGFLYSGMGYTTVNDAAISPSGAYLAHQELAETPLVDRSFLTLAGNHRYLLEILMRGESQAKVDSFVRWLIWRTGSLGIKVVNPGGIEAWKQGQPRITDIDEMVHQFGVTPRLILESLCRSAKRIGLPHAVHLHGQNLGLPGNSQTTLKTLQAIDGLPVHLAHVQFHSYGGDPDDASTLSSSVESLVEHINNHPEVSVDVGQVLFGPTTIMTADGATAQYLSGLTRGKLLAEHVELETGCGVMPIEYKDKNLVHAVQWATGLEWFLRTDNPWQTALSTDHPNGAAFTAYPELIALLVDSNYRNESLARLPEAVRERTALRDISREMSLSEIAIITRAAPARMLGLNNKGHLGPGADGDVTIYQPSTDIRKMFSLPRWVIKSGEIVMDDTEIRSYPAGVTNRFHQPKPDQDELELIQRWWNENATYDWSFATIGEELRSSLGTVESRNDEFNRSTGSSTVNK